MLRESNAPASTVRPLKDARAGAGARPHGLASAEQRAGVARINTRAGTRALYASHLATATSRAGDAYSARTIEGYLEAVDMLGAYLTARGFAGDYPDVDTETLNAFLADYRKTHTQGGTNTKLRRLRGFFNWLEATYETPNPYRTGKVAYYAPSQPPPSALGADVAGDLLAVCKPQRGTATEFEDTRDTAILALLRTGVRRGELVGIWVEDIDWAGQTVQVGALKDARRRAGVLRVVDGQEHRAGRHVPLSDEAMLALQRWLRVRAGHRLVGGRGTDPRVSVDTGPLWYATRGRGPLTGNGILRMIKRRAQEAGYDPATINVHAFRHTRADQLLAAGVEEGDVMGVMGWRDRSMLDRYAANLKNARAIENVRRAGLA
ncbi:MAG: site-specific integrase [Candidatus Dormibacteraeota bacterium]|nr:site-specific integrase [Candidatus Dormibacteraeota bacterium]